MIIKYNKISDFKIINSFGESDFFLKSEKNPSLVNAWQSYAVSGESVFNLFKTYIESQSFNFVGNWMLSSFACLQTHISNIDSLSSAVSIKWCNDNLLSELNKLSSQLFNSDNTKLKLPSYVGQVIISNTLSTQTDIKQIYGGEEWVQIKGRFLLATGANDPSTDIGTSNKIRSYGKSKYGEINVSRSKKTGGEKTTTLKIQNVPGHSHTINGMPWGKLPPRSFSITLSKKSEARYGVIPIGVDVSDFKKVGHKNYTHGGERTKGDYADPDSLISIGEITGSGTIEKTFSFKPKATVASSCGNSSGGVDPHNNMPPYVVQYIWERTK